MQPLWVQAIILPFAGRLAFGSLFTRETILETQFLSDQPPIEVGSQALCRAHCQNSLECHGFQYVFETAICFIGQVDMADDKGGQIKVWLTEGMVYTSTNVIDG